MDKRKPPKKRISRSLLLGTLVMLVVLGVAIGVLGSSTYKRGMMARYEAQLESMLRLTAAQIDGDDLARCIETGEQSEAYRQLQAYLDDMKMTCDLKYVYVVKPLNTEAQDNMMNVIAGVSDTERELYADMLVQLGERTGTEYSPEVARMYLERMDRSDSITYYSNTTEFGYMYTGLTPIHDGAGDPVAILAIDVAMDEIHRTQLSYNLLTGGCVALLALLSFAFTYYWLRRRIIQPVEKLRNASTKFVESSRSTQDPAALTFEDPQIRTQDEMEELSDTLMAMSEDMKKYMKTLVVNAAEQERVGAEFKVAKQIQADMLPNDFPAFPEHGEFDLSASLISSKEICGDFYDYFLIDEDHLGLVVADVSDKGVPAALFMIIAKTLIKNQALQGFGPGAALQNVNEQLLEGNRAGLFVSVWFAVLELSTGKGVAVNAGQQHPILRRAGKRFELQRYNHELPVGAFENVRYRDHGFQLEPGDTLFMYTDGVKETVNAAGERYDTERILDALNREPDASPNILVQTLCANLERYGGGSDQEDDQTLLCLKYYGPKGDQE